MVERLTRRYDELAREQGALEFLRELERYLRAIERERPARRVLRRFRDDLGEAMERLNTLERLDGETDAARAQHIQALERFREEVQTLPGLAEERLRLVSDALAAAEPSLIEQGEPEPEFARRASLHGLDQLPSIKVMHRALTGEAFAADERRELEAEVGILRGDARRLHDELVERICRGEGEAQPRLRGFIDRLFRRIPK